MTKSSRGYKKNSIKNSIGIFCVLKYSKNSTLT